MIDKPTEEKILAAANIFDIVGEHIALTKKGQHYYGICPFHEDKSPSLTVTPSIGRYKCFACGAGGDSVDFLRKYKKLTYYEALKCIAEKYNIEIPQNNDRVQLTGEAKDRESMLAVNQTAMQYYESMLPAADDGAGIEYFRSRNINEEILKKFHIGYCPKCSDIISSVKEGKKDIKYLFHAGDNITFKSGKSLKVDNGVGIIRQNSETKRFNDVFYGRVIFPWFNSKGHIIAFGGRKLVAATKGVEQKYINSSESLIFHKAEELYGIYQAMDSIKQNDCVYLVEGYLDVLSLHQIGICNVVANSGTALTQQQIALLKRHTQNIVLVYDADMAGIKAALRSINLIIPYEMHVSCLLLPEGEDPDSFVHNHSKEEVLDYFKTRCKDFLDFECKQLIHSDDEPVIGNQAIRSVMETISLIKDGILRELYFKKLLRICGIKEFILREEFDKLCDSSEMTSADPKQQA